MQPPLALTHMQTFPTLLEALLPALDEMISSVATATRTQRVEKEGRVRLRQAYTHSLKEKEGLDIGCQEGSLLKQGVKIDAIGTW